MAGRRKEELPPNDPSLTADFWAAFTDHPQPTVRQKLVFLAMDDVGKRGARDFNGISICQRLAVSASLINHYFGGRNGLIAEATAMAYVQYVLRLRDAAAQHRTGEDALRAWMRAQVAWAAEHPGFAEILNYSSAHREVSELVHRDFQRDIQQHFEFNIAMIYAMVVAIRERAPLDLPVEPGDVDKRQALTDNDAMALTSSVAWSTLGAAVWASGQHTPSSHISELEERAPMYLDMHIDNVIASVQRSKTS